MQVKGEWRINNETLREIHDKIKLIITNFDHFSINYIPRRLNIHADSLANKAMDNYFNLNEK